MTWYQLAGGLASFAALLALVLNVRNRLRDERQREIDALALATAEAVARAREDGERAAAEHHAKTSSRDALLHIEKRVESQDVKLDKLDTKLDAVIALVVKVDRIEDDQRETRGHVAELKERVVALETIVAKETA